MSTFQTISLRPQTTGLPLCVWLAHKAGSHREPTIRLSPSHRHEPEFEILVALCPTVRILKGDMARRDFELLQTWINLNLPTILAFWNEDIDDEDLRAAIRKVQT